MLAWLKREKIDHPLAEPKGAARIIDGLSARDPVRALEEANQWLLSINETAAFKLQRRLELIDALDVATRKSQERLCDSYVVLPEGDAQEKRMWQAASQFWKLLADGYLACARQSRDINSVPAAVKAQLPLVVARGLRALRGQMKWTLLHYTMLRAEFWSECGRLIALAESMDCAEAPIELFGTSVARSSPNDEMLRIMMFWAAMPSGLSPVEQDIAERLVQYLTPKFRSSARAADDYDFFFDLDGSRPPLRFVRSAPVGATTRFFDVGEGRAAVHEIFSAMARSGNLPVGVNWGPASENNIILRVLKHLSVNWSKELPSRAASRQKSEASVEAVHGYSNVLGLVAPQQASGLAANAALLAETWVTEDMSDGGCGVIVPHSKGEGLRVGVLVALREQADAPWKIGLIRRIGSYNYRQHHVGVQFLSLAPTAVFLRTLTGAKQGRKREGGILLSARPTPSGYLHILMRRDLFSGREPVEVLFGGQETPVMLQPGGVVESGHDFDWLRYQAPEAKR